MAGGRLAHPGHAEVLAQGRGLLQIEIVQRHDAIDDLAARQVADAGEQVVELPLHVHVGHVKRLGDGLARPRRVAEALGGDEQHTAAEAVRFAEEVVALVVGRQAENRHRGIMPTGRFATIFRMNKVLVAVAALVVIGAIAFFVTRSGRAPSSRAPVATTPAVPPVTRPESRRRRQRHAPAPAKKAPVAKKTEPAPAEPATPAAPTRSTLVLESDVPGASVFLNREYVGTTPLRLDKLEPGTKQLKFTADGYEGIERTVELEAGRQPRYDAVPRGAAEQADGREPQARDGRLRRHTHRHRGRPDLRDHEQGRRIHHAATRSWKPSWWITWRRTCA